MENLTGMNKYVGLRYVPLVDGEWTNTLPYEPLVVVTHEGNSYTSKTFVPVGVDITNDKYWVLTGNYNAQVELYRQETKAVADDLTELRKRVGNVLDYGAIGDGKTDSATAIQNAIDANDYVVFPQGVYLVSKQINLKSDLVIEGQSATLVFPDSLLSGNMLGVPSGSSTYKNVTVKGMRFQAFAVPTSPQPLVSCEFLNGTNVEFTQCSFTGFHKNLEFTNCTNVVVSECVFDDATETSDKINGYGVLIESGVNVRIENNTINAERHAVYLNGFKNAIVKGNTLIGAPTWLDRYSDYEGVVKITVGDGAVVSGNTISGGVYSVGFFGGSDLPWAVTENVTVCDNVMRERIANPGFEFGYALLHSSATANRCVYSGNIIKGVNKLYRGFVLEGKGSIQLINNTLNLCETCVRVSPANDNDISLNITDNRFFDSNMGLVFAKILSITGSRNGFSNVTQIHPATPNVNDNTVMIHDNYDINNVGSFVSMAALTSADASTHSIIVLNPGTPVDFTTLTGAFNGQVVTINAPTGNLTITTGNAGNLKLSSNFQGGPNKSITFRKINAAAWFETGRS